MRPTMSGRPLLSWVASQSSVMVPELPGMVVRSACAIAALSPRQPARTSAPASLLATGALVPGGDGDAIGGPGSANRLLEVHVVVRTDGAGDEAHPLRGDLTVRIERLHEQARRAVASLATFGDDASHDERVSPIVLRRLPVDGDSARVADLGRATGSRGSGRRLCRAGCRFQPERAGERCADDRQGPHADTSPPFRSARRGQRFPAGGSETRERALARSGAERDAAGDEAGVARDLAQVVQDGQKGAGSGGAALALHQPLFMSPRIFVGHVLEAKALDLHVSRHPREVNTVPSAAISWQQRMRPSMESPMRSTWAGTRRSEAVSAGSVTRRSVRSFSAL